MQKKLIMACAAIAAFAAFVVAPVASASPVLTDTGKAVPVGTEIIGSDPGNVLLFTSPYAPICSTFAFNFIVTTNSGTKIKLELPVGKSSFSGTGAGGDCTSSLGAFSFGWNSKLCLETAEKDTVAVTGCGQNATFTTNITSGPICKYHASSFVGTFATNSDATFTFTNQPFVREENVLCPMQTSLDMAIDLTTTAGETLFIS